jgi:pimeloyl-ACP methyl ester carboxylesterase
VEYTAHNSAGWSAVSSTLYFITATSKIQEGHQKNQSSVPVVLIHGFRSSSVTWTNLITELDKSQIKYWIFDYSDYNTADPRDTANSLNILFL